MNKKKEIFPQLRFGGYKSKWIIDSFDFEFLQTNSFSRAEMDDEKGNVKNIHYGDILTKYNDILRDISVVPFVNKNIDLSKFREESYLKNGDIVIADTAEDFTAGKAVEVLNVDFPVLAGQHTFLCRPKIKFAPGFMGYYLNSPSYHNRLIPLLTGTKVYSISKANIKSTFVLYPENYEEQQKIADCLSSIDELIDAESRKLKALEKYKKGLMQKLFPAEGKTVPEWRFPEFKHCGNWEQATLTKVAFYENGKAHENYIEEYGKYIVVNSKFIATDGEVTKHSNTANLLAKRGDILMVLSDVPNGRALAKCYFVDENDKYTVNQRICRLRPYDIDSLFLFYYVNRNKYFLDFDDGVKQTNLKKSDVLACLLLKPKEKREQQKIADCLSEIDTMITEQLKKIERLETHKKGLLQGLFPSLEEVDV